MLPEEEVEGRTAVSQLFSRKFTGSITYPAKWLVATTEETVIAVKQCEQEPDIVQCLRRL